MATILVVDDDEPSLSILVGLICAAGHTAFGVANGRDALRNAEYAAPDLILCDVLMPGMDGRKLLQQFRYLGLRKVPVVAVSALASSVEREDLLAAGFDGHIPKPIAPQTLLQQLEQYLGESPDPAAEDTAAGTRTSGSRTR